MDDIRQVRAVMDEKRLAALETLGAVVRWLRETKPSEIFYVEGEGKAGKAPVPTMSEEHLRVIWQRWVAKASDVLEREARSSPICSFRTSSSCSGGRVQVPDRREHLRAARALLGWADPLVHRLMDEAPLRMGMCHRYATHNAEYLVALERLLGRAARLEATLHLLQDWRVVVPADYRYLYCRGRS